MPIWDSFESAGYSNGVPTKEQIRAIVQKANESIDGVRTTPQVRSALRAIKEDEVFNILEKLAHRQDLLMSHIYAVGTYEFSVFKYLATNTEQPCHARALLRTGMRCSVRVCASPVLIG